MTEPTGTTIGGGGTGGGGKTAGPANYTLLSSVDTVQVLSPTVVNDVLYCTAQTSGHGVIFSYPIPAGTFESASASAILSDVSLTIDSVMNLPNVVAAVGTQILDESGLLADNVSFTVEYVPPGTEGTSITGVADIPVTMLRPANTGPGMPDLTAIQAEIDKVYANLQSLAGG